MNNIKDDFIFFKNNPDIVYLDNAATTQKPDICINAITEYYGKYNTNIFRSVNKLTDFSEKEYYRAKDIIASSVGMKGDEIAFTYNATDSLNIIAEIVTCNFVKKNGNVIVSSLEHHSNILPWIKYCQRYNYAIRYIPLNSDGEIDYSALSSLIDNDTICVSITGASNINGNITDIEFVSDICKQKGVPLILDLTQLVHHVKVDLSKIRFEYAAFSSHKMYGPSGLGILVCGNEEASNQIGRAGGGMIDDATETSFVRKKGAVGFEAGTQNIPSVIGLARTREYLDSLKPDVYKKEIELKNEFLDYLENSDGIRVVKHIKNTVPVVAFNFEYIHASDANMILDKMGIYVRSGKFCAYKAMKELGEESALRVSFGIYNTRKDLEKLTEGLEYIKKKYGKSAR